MKNKFSLRKAALPITTSLLVLLVLFRVVDYVLVWSTLKSGNLPLIVFLTVALTATLPFLFALRWQQMLRVLGHTVNLGVLVQLQLATFPISKLSPGNVGDLMKAYYLKDQVSYKSHMGGVVFERMTDLVVLFSLAVIGGVVAANNIAIVVGALAILGLCGVFLFIRQFSMQRTNYSLIQQLQSFLVVYQHFSHHRRESVLILFYSLTAWLFIFLYIYLLFVAFDSTLSFVDVLALQPLAIAVGLVPITLAGIGTREAAMLALYAPLLSAPQILAVGIVYSVFSSVILSLAGLPFLSKGFARHNNERVTDLS